MPQALSETEIVCSSINVATAKTGINAGGVREVGVVIEQTACLARERDSIDCAKHVVFLN